MPAPVANHENCFSLRLAASIYVYQHAASFMSPRAQHQAKLHPSQLRTLRSRLRASIRDASLTDISLNNREATVSSPFWELEPSPLVIAPSEWQLLQDALRQRARMINALISDIYSEQRLLRSKIVPPEVILADPYYRRPCLGLESNRPTPATVLRFDLVKSKAGWVFTRTRTNTPMGISYAVQNRRFMTQEAGDYYRSLPEYLSVINFPLRLLDVLRNLAPDHDRPASIVVLTAGPLDPFYSEHSFLARKMGLPLARGDDLLVLDNRVYFKTIGGLEPVDVIYRRLNDAYIDPVVFSTSHEMAGIPGLLQCIRSGTVLVANSIGTGIAENRTLDAYIPQLTRFYLGEKPFLPTLPTYSCGDTDQLDYILDNADQFRIRPAQEVGPWETQTPENPSQLFKSGRLAREVRENPFAYVGQAAPESVGISVGGRTKEPYCFTGFVLCDSRRYDVFPGGLVRLGSTEPPQDRVGRTVDALALANSVADGEISDYETPSAGVRVPLLGSRAADCLLWLGRYLERAESSARMLSILEDVALEEIPNRDRRRWLPFWRGLLEATGHAGEKLSHRRGETLTVERLWRMTLDRGNSSSIISSIDLAHVNARQLRDHVSPEAWSLLLRLRNRLSQLAQPKEKKTADSLSQHAQIESGFEVVLTEVNAFLSTAERTMLHDAGWQFLRIGLHLERAIMTCSALRHILGEHDLHAGDMLYGNQSYNDNPELTALLRMLGSQDAYRRLYQTRAQPHLVAELLLRQPDAPRSLFYLLHTIKSCLRAVQMDLPDELHGNIPVSTIDDLLRHLAALPLTSYFTGVNSTPGIAERLAWLLNQLYSLHSLLADHFVSHQANIAPSPNQSELDLTGT